MANRRYNQFYNTLHKYPVQLDCNFIVDSTNGNGLGIRSLKGAGIEDVFMHTTASFTGTSHTSTLVDSISPVTTNLTVGMPVHGSGIAAGTTIATIVSSTSITLSAATSTSTTGSITFEGLGNSLQANPNPAAGNILVKFEDNYNYYIGGYSGFISPVSGTQLAVTSGLTVGVVYTIVVLGTTTAADWVTLGLPVGTTAAVGVAFVAIATGAGAGTGKVETALSTHSGCTHIEGFGDPNLSITSAIGAATGASAGPYALFKCIGTKFAAFTGDTHTNTTVDALSSLSGLAVGEVISGAGIPLGTTITAVGASSITLSAAATASTATVPMTAGPYDGLKAPADGTVIGMTFLFQNSAITNQGY